MIKPLILFIEFSTLALGEIFTRITEKQRKKPLPEEVSDVYDAERYQTFLSYKSEQKKLSNVRKVIYTVITLVLLFSPFYHWMETTFKTTTKITLATFLFINIIDAILSLIIDYITTFKIREKYGLNKKDKKEFYKDELINFVFSIIIVFVLVPFAIYVIEHLSVWTNGFTISLVKCFLICGLIALVGYGVILLLSVISLVALKLQYTITDLEEGELRDKINDLQKDSKKKVKHIKVYNESKKSNGKNAFLLKLLGFRLFGIADNFLADNSQNQLLGVLAHEVGHLKHKKNIFNYSVYGIYVLLFLAFAFSIHDPSLILRFTSKILNEFDCTKNNYYLLFYIYSTILTPFASLFSIYRTNITRKEEYEADQNAAKEGYAEDLITTFKQLSNDELVDVNPAPVIEFLTYDHPGMANRIKALRKTS